MATAPFDSTRPTRLKGAEHGYAAITMRRRNGWRWARGAAQRANPMRAADAAPADCPSPAGAAHHFGDPR